ncbi:hypothetical protein OBBRIDRAFT_823660 [Obba rivulosa]|uniref:Protein kinase domain-containing protein n=1 Tax=Obba rivulosa TaxID=1052685 RepID=A0A8E2J3W4_9APHY|nr:hypothetical protein OBBRIDRAFT_823660 [Obba rivulosa]
MSQKRTPAKYVWRADELLELQTRGVILLGRLDYMNVVQLARNASGEEIVVKSMRHDSNELKMLRKLLSLPSTRNRVVPCEFIPCEDTTLAIMPALHALEGYIPDRFTVEEVLDIMGQFIEAVDFMHEHRIAFGDVAFGNAIHSLETTLMHIGPWKIPPNRIYFIDFEAARSFPNGPGEGLRINDWLDYGGHFEPPEGRDGVDPYSYDVYSLGQSIFEFCKLGRRQLFSVPRSLSCVLDSMRSDDPLQRPAIRRISQMFPVLRYWVVKTQWLYQMLPRQLAGSIDYYGWRLLSMFT